MNIVKDILEILCNDSNINYVNVLPEGRNNNIFSFTLSFLRKYMIIISILIYFLPYYEDQIREPIFGENNNEKN